MQLKQKGIADTMEIKRLILGMVRTNCYIVYTEDTKKAVIIDPAADSRRITEEISALGR